MRLEFKAEYDYENQPTTTVEVTTDAVALEDILPVFKQFLLACGFVVDGELDIVGEDDENLD